MSLATAPDDSAVRGESRVVVDATSHRRRAWVLLAFAAWNVWVWATRLINLLGDREDFSVGFVVVHVVLFVGGFGGAALLAAIGWRMRREVAEAASGTTP